MYRIRLFVMCALAAFLMAGSMVMADAPSLISFQGILTDVAGNPLANDSKDITIKICATDGVADPSEFLWSQSFSSVPTDASGGFSVILSGFDQEMFDDIELWLEIEVAGSAMTPRQRLSSAPYAVRAGDTWSLTGNEGLSGAENFLGTTDGVPLNFRARNERALRLEPSPLVFPMTGEESPNVIGGHETNQVTNDAKGATIGGGGYYNDQLIGGPEDARNKISQDFATVSGGADNKGFGRFAAVGGGYGNTASGEYSTIPGGYNCQAAGDYSFAAGSKAHADHSGSFVFADASSDAIVSSNVDNQVKFRASGGVTLGGGVDSKLKVQDANNQTNILLDGGTGDVEVGGSVNGDVRVYDNAAVEGIRLNGATHTARLLDAAGSESIIVDGEDHAIRLYSTECGPDNATIRLNGETGTIATPVLKITGGCDVAEPFMMTDDAQFPEGAVVVIDADNPGRTTLSSQAYDPRVAGIISGAGDVNPGLTLSQQGVLEGGQNVALSGRVYCLVTASNGAIRPGDMLTTSNLPGHAMKATDRNRAYGTVIGKAMTSLDSGEGLVLVLVNLQ